MNNHGYYRDDGCESDCATHNEPAYPNGECDCIASLSQRLRKLSAENKGPRDCIDEAADALDRLKQDSDRLEWLMRNVSGKEFRRLGVIYGGNCGRDRIDAAMKVGAGDTARPPTPTGWSDTDWIKHLQERGESPHPLAGLHINQGSMDAAADAYEAEYNARHNVELTGSRAGLSPVSPATEGSEVERRVGGAAS